MSLLSRRVNSTRLLRLFTVTNLRQFAGTSCNFHNDAVSQPEHGIETSNNASSDHQKGEFPEELLRSNVMHLTCHSLAEGGTCNVYVVGTCHVSQRSCREVHVVINHFKPQVVFLELCEGRNYMLTRNDFKTPTLGEMVEMLKKKHNPLGVVLSWYLAKVATKLGVFPGSEFRVAYNQARKYGAKVVLGDRPAQITLRRSWEKMPPRHKIKLLFGFISAAFLLSPQYLRAKLKEMDASDMVTLAIEEMAKQFPTLMETLVHERDQYLSSMLLKVASQHSSVVAVVGKGHLQGIRRHWKQPIDVKKLLEIPRKEPGIFAKIFFSISYVAGSVAAGVATIWKK